MRVRVRVRVTVTVSNGGAWEVAGSTDGRGELKGAPSRLWALWASHPYVIEVLSLVLAIVVFVETTLA